jgi:thioredoxin-related protein
MVLTRRALLASSAAALALPGVVHAATVNDDGLHSESWFIETFLDVRQDIADATAKGRRLAYVFEQRGCIYCTEMHEKVLSQRPIADYIAKHFDVVQLNMFGAREVTDLDGKTLTEKELVRKWGVTVSPFVYFAPEQAESGKSLRDTASAKMRGLLPPAQFLAMFKFVAGRHYKEGDFPAFVAKHEPGLSAAIARGTPIN